MQLLRDPHKRRLPQPFAAGSVILVISVVLWFLASYPKLPEGQLFDIQTQQLTAVADKSDAADDDTAKTAAQDRIDDGVKNANTGDPDASQEAVAAQERQLAQSAIAYSYAGRLGRLIEPVFEPLGFDWKIDIAVLSSFAAREVLVSTLSIVYGLGEDGSEDEGGMISTLQRQTHADGSPVFDLRTSLSLLVFYVLAMQCLPTQAVTRRETGSWKWAILQLVFMTVLAYVASWLTFTAFGGR